MKHIEMSRWGVILAVILLAVAPACVWSDPDPIPEPAETGTLAVSSQHACAITDDSLREVECWGNGFLRPQRIPGLSMIDSLALGGRDVGFAIGVDGTVWEIRGELDGADAVPGLEGVVEIAAGRVRSCAILQDGTVGCWRDDEELRLIDGLEGVVRISVDARADEGCAVLADGGVACWRWDDDHHRHDHGGSRVSFAAVQGLSDVVDVTRGLGHACALVADGTVRCWGENSHGQLGDGTTRYRDEPVAARGVRNAVQIDAGDMHTCARIDDGSVECWGFDYYGQIGDGQADEEPHSVASTVADLVGATDISLGGHSSCARTDLGEVLCWGDNVFGQLGDGTSTVRPSPVPVDG